MAWKPDYVTAAELRQYVTSSAVEVTADEAEFPRAIAAASRAIDKHCNRQFGLVAAPEARYYTPRWDHNRARWYVEIDDLMTVTGIEVMADIADAGTYTSAITDYALKPVNAAAEGMPWTGFFVLPTSTDQPVSYEDSVEVTARWGWTTVPTAVKEACLLQAHRFAVRRNSPFGIAGSPDTGGELRLLAKVDADVAVSLGSYVRWWGAA